MLPFQIISILHNFPKLVIYLLLGRNCKGRRHVCKESWSQTSWFKISLFCVLAVGSWATYRISCSLRSLLCKIAIIILLYYRGEAEIIFCVKHIGQAQHKVGVNQRFLMLFPLLSSPPCTEQVFNRGLLSEWMTGLNILPPGGSSASLTGLTTPPDYQDSVKLPPEVPEAVWRTEPLLSPSPPFPLISALFCDEPFLFFPLS